MCVYSYVDYMYIDGEIDREIDRYQHVTIDKYRHVTCRRIIYDVVSLDIDGYVWI